MKKLLLVGLLALGSQTGYGQAAKLLKNANTIVIQTSDSATVALRKLGQAFVAQGFTVEKYDPQFLTLTLAPKTLSGLYSPILIARASASSQANSTLRLAGDYKATVLAHPITDVVSVTGSEKGVPITSFRLLEKVALTYPGGQVSYSKQ